MKTESYNCNNTGKYCYSSEAKATRAMGRYDDIKRVYLCEDCGKWHTTKMGLEKAISLGIVTNSSKMSPNSAEVQKRIYELKTEE